MASILGSPAFLTRLLSTPPLSCSQTPRSQPPPTPQPLQSQPQTPAQPSSPPPPKPQQKPKLAAESTDWVASSLTRRFGLGAGLAWVGFLAAGVISEQIKTRLEVSQEQANTKLAEKEEEVVLPNGIKYTELRVGGGATPRPGDLVVIDLQGRVEGRSQAFVDTFGEGKRPLALVMGSRPYTKGMCEGVEYVLRSMKAGGKRKVTVPASLGFGDEGADLGSGVRIPPAATLEFVVQIDKGSVDKTSVQPRKLVLPQSRGNMCWDPPHCTGRHARTLERVSACCPVLGKHGLRCSREVFSGFYSPSLQDTICHFSLDDYVGVPTLIFLSIILIKSILKKVHAVAFVRYDKQLNMAK
ncbi:peptidyl-prolyl cis-trans isomerase FKBP17-2, chloroplastic [Canna indica]|uniref:peptidylprolyl isomerase n=1 Tax=Canna indica TaxID=4628 RepID=A0AAQ3Q5X3_9LILI|nr:peptidyl-prolyl cis-trans isomerase FKBP17-2, chloroplastic [Canna indica]